MLALDIGPGDVVLVPSITFLASANAVRYVGADVVFVDVDPTTGLMTSETLNESIIRHSDKNLKAVVNVHLAGQCEDLESLYTTAKERGLFIIEDAAHAIGTIYKDHSGNKHPIGSNAFSDLTTFSFHPVKTIAMGEGGAVTTNENILAERLRSYRNHGMIRKKERWEAKEETGAWYYEMHELGYNFRASDINCALGLSQLDKLEAFKVERARIVAHYDSAFSGLQNVTPFRKLTSSDTAWHLYIVHIDFKALGETRTEVMLELRDQGIGTQVHYIPVYQQPYYKKLCGEVTLPGAEMYYKGCLTLPLYPTLSSVEQSKVIKAIRKYAA
jgi:dTDP-4-amino-4,6-dideoxygalactose transaminase